MTSTTSPQYRILRHVPVLAVGLFAVAAVVVGVIAVQAERDAAAGPVPP